MTCTVTVYFQTTRLDVTKVEGTPEELQTAYQNAFNKPDDRVIKISGKAGLQVVNLDNVNLIQISEDK